MRYKGSVISGIPPTITPPTGNEAGGTAKGIWTTEHQLQEKQAGNWPRFNGESVYIVNGTFTFVAPANIHSVSVLCIGPTQVWINTQKIGRGGGGLGYKNDIPVVPGSSYTVVVGSDGSDSYFISTSTVKGGGATSTSDGGTFVGDGGGNGGNGGPNWGGSGAGGGGAGGYNGNGGNGGPSGGYSGYAAATGSGAGGGGAGSTSGGFGGGGGGVGIYGIGSDGVAGIYDSAANYVPGGGGGGSGGENGSFINTGGGYGSADYGGGKAGTNATVSGGSQRGVVRIIYPGNLYTFPNNAPQTGV
jgi:hypothetical protein